MDFALRDLPALVKARRSGNTFTSERAAASDSKAKPETASGPDVATALDALRAVLPATLITLYSSGVILLQNLTNAAGSAQRAAEQAALSNTYPAGSPQLQQALGALSAEPTAYGWARMLFAAICTLLVAFYAYNTSQVEGDKKHVILEPVVVTLVFIAWVLASPGTFLATYLNSNDLAVMTILVAFTSAIALYVISSTILKKKKKRS